MNSQSSLGNLRPYCDPSKVGFFEAIASNTCDWGTQADYDAQQTQLNQQGLPAGSVPNCDPNAGVLANIFSNDCNVSVPDALNQVTGFNIPQWGWFLGAGVIVFLLIKR